MSFVYVLYSDTFKRFYVGIADNIESRLRNHNTSKVKSTKAFIPWRIVHVEEFNNKQEARVREKYLKSAAGRRWRKNNIKLGD
jgi:putative endonuclease